MTLETVPVAVAAPAAAAWATPVLTGRITGLTGATGFVGDDGLLGLLTVVVPLPLPEPLDPDPEPELELVPVPVLVVVGVVVVGTLAMGVVVREPEPGRVEMVPERVTGDSGARYRRGWPMSRATRRRWCR